MRTARSQASPLDGEGARILKDGARVDKMDLGIDGRQWAVLALTLDEFENSILNENGSPSEWLMSVGTGEWHSAL
jgi:hypothetical protein